MRLISTLVDVFIAEIAQATLRPDDLYHVCRCFEWCIRILSECSVFTDCELEEVTVPFSPPLPHHLCIVGAGKQLDSVLNDADGHIVVCNNEHEKRRMG